MSEKNFKELPVATVKKYLEEVDGMVSDEFGQHCLYCEWFSYSFSDAPQHSEDCLIARIERFLKDFKEWRDG